jgi:hypothetical protein
LFIFSVGCASELMKYTRRWTHAGQSTQRTTIAAVGSRRKGDLRVASQVRRHPSLHGRRRASGLRCGFLYLPHLSTTLPPPGLSIQFAHQPTAPCPSSPRSAAPRGPRRARTAAAPRSAPAPASPRRTRTERQVHPRLHQGALGRGVHAARRGRRAARRAPASLAVRLSRTRVCVCAGLSARAGRSRSSWRSCPSTARAASTCTRGRLWCGALCLLFKQGVLTRSPSCALARCYRGTVSRMKVSPLPSYPSSSVHEKF